MSYLTILFAPLVIMLPAAGTVESDRDIGGKSFKAGAEQPTEQLIQSSPADPADQFQEGMPFRLVADAFRAEDANQVRIEERVTIRVSPRPQAARPNMLMDLPSRAVGPRFLERKIGKCLKVGGIAGVQAAGGNQLLLFMRDQRVVSADLERSCRARDFYSGFYLSRSTDGQLCVDRDTLLSRSGANCKLTRMRQLVEPDD
jgi:hypothetical protein